MNDTKINLGVDWGDGIKVLTRPMCTACQELKRRLREAGIPFRELDLDTVDGRAAAAWYGGPTLLPAVAVNGRLLEGSGNVDALFGGAAELRGSG